MDGACGDSELSELSALSALLTLSVMSTMLPLEVDYPEVHFLPILMDHLTQGYGRMFD